MHGSSAIAPHRGQTTARARSGRGVEPFCLAAEDGFTVSRYAIRAVYSRLILTRSANQFVGFSVTREENVGKLAAEQSVATVTSMQAIVVPAPV
jgi:hypothetical protein